jgi:excisionase family DNA binding protein
MVADKYPFSERTYSPAQVATICGVKTATVYAWLSRHELRASKVGHNRFISEGQIRDFYLRRTTGEYVDYTYSSQR